MNRIETCKKRIESLVELQANGAELDAIMCDLLCDIAESLASIADSLDGVVKVEQIKTEPMQYAYYFGNGELCGARGGNE